MIQLRQRPGRVALLAIAACLPAFAQHAETYQATIRGKGDVQRGKCTLEVRVDEVAEVEFSGDTGFLRTLAGRPASWTRIDCSSPMPPLMRDFRFSGVDGRGRQTLVADPRNNHGIVVVRLEDPKPGFEGYTFDLLWSGGSPSSGRLAANTDSLRYISCSSENGRRLYCDADTSRGVRLVRQYGEACRQGETWGYDDRGIWVDRGCRGDFQPGQ